MRFAPIILLTYAVSGQTLTVSDVENVIQSAAKSVNAGMSIAVTDRQGNILGVFQTPGAPSTSIGNFGVAVDTNDLAVALARTTAFFSNDQAPLTSRTVRSISASHFPAGIMFTESGPLYGIENTNRGCSLNANFIPGQAIPPATLTATAACGNSRRHACPSGIGLGVITGKADLLDSDQSAVNPGGIPLFKQGVVAGGVGVAGVPANTAEFVALSGAVGAGLGPPSGVIFLGGIALPEVVQTTQPAGTSPGSGMGMYIVPASASPGPAPDGYLVAPVAGPIGGLTQAEVEGIVTAAIATANQTRAAIRLPAGATARMSIAITDLDGTLIALNRMPDGTFFSIDVAVAKARNVIYFTQTGLPNGVPPGTAVTNRTIGFGSQPLYPSGIDDTPPGPFFSLYQYDTANPCTQGGQTPNPNQNGIVFFPGSVPLYKNGVLVGGLGVSGDGVDQDDYVTAQAALSFAAPSNITADNLIVRSVRLPYLKFPRNPTVQ
jgi:uncharacterized protein GlcG (DUF336 family)